MAKIKRKTNYSFIIVITSLIITIGVLIYLISVKQELLIEEKEINKQLTEELNEKGYVYNENKNTNDELKSEIDRLTNLNQSKEMTKEEIFELAKNLENKILKGETEYKIAYLTFDDGPYYLTDKYLEVLDKYNVKATFFTIGAGKEKCYDNRSIDCTTMYKKIAENGHTIANHTYSHNISYGLYKSTTYFMQQVKKQEELLKKHTGVTTNIIRFPGGSSTARGLKNSIIEELRKNNYGWVDWTSQDGDGGQLNSTTEAWNNFTRTINQDIEVVLFHDYSRITIQILPDVIEYLQERNYILLPLFYESVMINK